MLPFDAQPRFVQQVGIVHSAGAGRLAGEATQAAVDVGDGPLPVLDFDLPFEDVLDQVDPSPRPFQFVAGELIGRAGGVAEPAVNASAQHLFRDFDLGVG